MKKLAALAGAALLLQCSVKIPKGEAQPEASCSDSEQCPAPDGPCLLTQCMEGSCVYVPAPQGPLPQEEQRAGDCKQDFCDGDGRVFSQAAPADIPRDDRNPCTEAMCDVGKPRQAPKPAGEACPKGVCNADGRCGECLPNAQRCVAEGTQLCTKDGKWSQATRCDALCTEGRCVAPSMIAAGGQHACALFEDGTARCWGTRNETPAGASAIVWQSGARVDLGPRHGCMVDNGPVQCWGAGDFGQLGNGQYESADAPVEAKLAAAVEVAVGDDHSCARTAQGEVHCWGRNDRGQLGSGRPAPLSGIAAASFGGGASQPRPKVLPATGIAALRVDGAFSCAQLQKGDTLCWGSPFEAPEAPNGAELTRRKKASHASPGKVAGVTGAVRLACAGHDCCVIAGDGSVRCWGAGDRGQLGAGTADSSKPVTVAGLPRASQLELGHDFGCALVEGDKLYCWGSNDRGQLGRGAPQATGEAQAVAIASAVRRFSVGDAFACALVDRQGLVCWGAGQAGQLGDGKRTDARAPVRVAW
jgi:alpha-tubulin suppressor-like RCC1 family protein